MSWGLIAYAAVICALVIAYLQGVKSYGLSGKRMIGTALIWVGIIGGGYLLAETVVGSS